MSTHLHPNHYTLGEVRVVDGKEYTLVAISPSKNGSLVAELCTNEAGGICAGCPHRNTADCFDTSSRSRGAICEPPAGSTPRGTTVVVVPLSIVPLLALHGALS